MKLTFIDASHPLYPQELELRYQVLRAPLGFDRSSVKFPFDAESLHLVAVDDGRVVGCVLFHPEGPHTGRLFQMAVEPSRQKTGLGAQLVCTLEEALVARGIQEVTLHARAHVAGFYEKLGYEVYGKPFVEVGIPHLHMRRRL
ncbi:GNAT family N-acetyltransferase [Archangium sp.]|uniref:GNAT family N-acetyltransferase n=1 Tax=Archangium sp. TaxID=1872627 RepID=UPI002D250AEC|nr:GNAT family N-acetyltransferase [Archangium sp.]HYO56143.1 GNAT family N-acetyltransferase [Archangium sp.]